MVGQVEPGSQCINFDGLMFTTDRLGYTCAISNLFNCLDSCILSFFEFGLLSLMAKTLSQIISNQNFPLKYFLVMALEYTLYLKY